VTWDNTVEEWEEIGRATTTPTEETKRTEVNVDEYYVVIGFEVNKPHALVNNVFDMNVDYGHAFFYAVKNGIITSVFSFGPGSGVEAKVGWLGKGDTNTPNEYNTGAVIKDGYKNSRPATVDFAITEMTRSFKLSLTSGQATRLDELVAAFRIKVSKNKIRYTVYMNDTCAEEARDILAEAGIETPSGAGKIKHSGIFNLPIIYAINPYRWHSKFIANGQSEKLYTSSDPEWLPAVGERDLIWVTIK